MKPNKLYILNSANMPQDGLFIRSEITEEEFKTLVTEATEIVSSIGYQEVSDHVEKVTGVRIPVNRGITSIAEDRAKVVVCRLKFRPEAYMKSKIKAKSGDYEYILIDYVSFNKSVKEWKA